MMSIKQGFLFLFVDECSILLYKDSLWFTQCCCETSLALRNDCVSAEQQITWHSFSIWQMQSLADCYIVVLFVILSSIVVLIPMIQVLFARSTIVDQQQNATKRSNLNHADAIIATPSITSHDHEFGLSQRPSPIPLAYMFSCFSQIILLYTALGTRPL